MYCILWLNVRLVYLEQWSVFILDSFMNQAQTDAAIGFYWLPRVCRSCHTSYENYSGLLLYTRANEREMRREYQKRKKKGRKSKRIEFRQKETSKMFSSTAIYRATFFASRPLVKQRPLEKAWNQTIMIDHSDHTSCIFNYWWYSHCKKLK